MFKPIFTFAEQYTTRDKDTTQGCEGKGGAYAGDVTVFLTRPKDVSTLQEAIQQYENAPGAQINLRKSTAIPLGTWDTNYPILNIPYRSGTTMLGTGENDRRNEPGELE
jgi:hypothetical protein